MAKVGGSILQATFNGRQFSVKADADASIVFTSNNKVEMNGDQTATLVKVVEPWQINDLVVSIDSQNGDRQYLEDLAQLPDFFPITVTTADEVVYSCVGQIVDASELKTMNNSISLSLAGPGKITQ